MSNHTSIKIIGEDVTVDRPENHVTFSEAQLKQIQRDKQKRAEEVYSEGFTYSDDSDRKLEKLEAVLLVFCTVESDSHPFAHDLASIGLDLLKDIQELKGGFISSLADALDSGES